MSGGQKLFRGSCPVLQPVAYAQDKRCVESEDYEIDDIDFHLMNFRLLKAVGCGRKLRNKSGTYTANDFRLSMRRIPAVSIAYGSGHSTPHRRSLSAPGRAPL